MLLNAEKHSLSHVKKRSMSSFSVLENPLPLTAGLILAAIAIFVVLLALIILYKRKKRRGFGGLGYDSPPYLCCVCLYS